MTEIDRRQFMRRVGVVLISSASAGLLIEVATPRSIRWHRVRRCWLQLDRWMAGPSSSSTSLARHIPRVLHETSEWSASTRLVAQHRRDLDALVRGGGLDEDVARELQAAFDGAATHFQRSRYAPGCYVAPWSGSVGALLGEDLLRQREQLDALDPATAPATVERAREAIERDLAVLQLRAHDRQLLHELLRSAQAGTLPDPAALEDIPETSAEAARLLAALFAGTL
jgi:hypothetical protein